MAAYTAAVLAFLFGPTTLLAAGRPRLHAVTYSNKFDARLVLPLASAEAHGMYPVVVGYGINAKWAWGLDDLVDQLRDYVFKNTDKDDLVLFFDAFDVVFQAGSDEIVDRYLEIEARNGIGLVYLAERKCSYGERQAEFPNVSTPYRYLNSGVYMGRAWKFKDLLKDSLSGKVVDKAGKTIRLQNWHIQYYLDHQDSVALDSGCELAQTVSSIDNVFTSSYQTYGTGLVLEDGRLRNKVTGSTPPILHFAGSGHWPEWRHPVRTGSCPAWEFFRLAGNAEIAAQMESEYLAGSVFALQPWKAICCKYITVFDRVAMHISRSGDKILWLVANAWVWIAAWMGLAFVLVVYFRRRGRSILMGRGRVWAAQKEGSQQV